MKDAYEKNRYPKKYRFFLYKLLSGNYAHSRAALAYYFLLSFFPLVIFVSLIISSLSESEYTIKIVSDHMIPSDVVNTIHSLINYTSSLDRETLISTGILMSLYGGARAVSCLSAVFNKIYELKENRSFIKLGCIYLGFSALFLIVLSVAIIVSAATPRILSYIDNVFRINDRFVHVWAYLRFLFMYLLFSALLLILYLIIPASRIKFRQAYPGAFAASAAWVGVSAALSVYVDNVAGYSFLYGSIGAIIVLMLWLYFTAGVLIAGARVNHYIMMRQGR